MCHNPYSAHWRHEKHHCPNLVPNEDDRSRFKHLKDVFQANIHYDKSSKYSFESLAHMWSEWHMQYIEADYPVLFSTYSFSSISAGKVLCNLTLLSVAFCIIRTVRFEE